MEQEQTGQVAPDAPETPAAGTTDDTSSSVTDAAAPTQDTPEAPTPDGTAPEATASAEETPEQAAANTKSRRDRQREARKQAAPPPAPSPSPEEIIRAYEANREAQQKAQQEAKEKAERYSKWLGEIPDASGQTEFQRVSAEASIPIPEGDDSFYTPETQQLVRRVNAARSRLAELSERRGMLAEVQTPLEAALTVKSRTEALGWLTDQFKAGLTALGGVDPEVVLAAGVNKPEDARMAAILTKYGEELLSPVNAELDETKDELAAAQSEIETLRRRLGGEAATTERGGVLGIGSANGPLTYERYINELTSEQRLALKQTPEGRAKIDAMTQGRVPA